MRVTAITKGSADGQGVGRPPHERRRDPQMYEAFSAPADQFFDYYGRALPPETEAKRWQRQVTISLPPTPAAEACRTYARVVWSRQAFDHVNPAALYGDGKGRLRQYSAKIVFPPKAHDSYGAPILVRFAGRSSGARLRDNGQVKQYGGLGETFELVARESTRTGKLSVRTWVPADEFTWLAIKSESFCNASDVSLTIDYRAAAPTGYS